MVERSFGAISETVKVPHPKYAALDLDEILAGDLDARAHVVPARVARYARLATPAPPVVVLETPEGRLLVDDGYHRAASRRDDGRG
jgi:hypothetical protein